MPRKRKGKHPEKALSAAQVRNQSKPGRYADGNGLYLVIDDAGCKYWVLRTIIKGKRRDIGLGGLSVVGLAKARDAAAQMRATARAGGDPLAERNKERRIVPTFEEAAREVHKSHSPSFRNLRHRDQWINTLIQYACPVFGSHRVNQVEPGDVLKALKEIWLEKPETARRVRQRIKTVFDWAKAAGHRTGDNPVDGISKALPKHHKSQEHFAAMPYAEAAGLMRQLQSYEGVSTRLAFEFLILNASRTGEVLFAEWSEFDLKSKTWTIPAGRMKAKIEHKVPLTARDLEILEEAKKIRDGGKYVFPGLRVGQPLSNMVFHMSLRRMKRTGITPHGFRSSFRDWSAEKTNFSRDVCEAALAHRLTNKTEAAYNRTDLLRSVGN